MSVCLINLLLLGLINALIIKAIAMHWHNSIFLDQSIPQGQHARSEVFFWRSKVFSTLSRVARWYQQHWTKCTHTDSSNRAWRPKITHNRARRPKNAPSSCISNPCQPCFACLAEQPNIQCFTNIWPGLNRIATPVNFLPLVSESDLWSNLPLWPGTQHVVEIRQFALEFIMCRPIQIWTSYLSSHILTMRRHGFSNHLWQVLAGDSLGTFDPPDIFAA